MLKEIIKPFQYEKIPTQEDTSDKTVVKKPSVKHSFSTLKRIWSFLAREKALLFAILLMVIVSSAMGLLGPFLVGKAIDDHFVTGEFSGLKTLIVILASVYLFHSISLFLQNYWMIGIAQNTIYTLRDKLFRQLHNLPIPFFDKRQHGELMSRVTNDIENVSATLNSSVIQIFTSILTLFGTVIVMLWLSPLLTLVTLTIVPMMVFGMKWITKRTGKLFKDRQKQLGDLNGYIEETISGQSIVKTFSQEEKVTREFLEKNKQLKLAGFWSQTFSGFIPKLMNMLNNLSFAVIAGVGGLFALQGLISIGTIVIFAEYARQFTRPLNDLANQFNTLLSAIAGAERVFQIIDEPEEEEDEKQAISLPEIRGEVEFRDVSFSYEKQGKTVDRINFKTLPGEMTALVGPTGAGKTTIINLLSRFYDSDTGSILIDGHEITDIKRGSLRHHMAFVLQDSFLFEGSIRENIRYGRLNASDEEVESAAKLANAHSFIMQQQNQYDTLLSQGGSGISQGQKQLISISRAILADPSILILDEATSSIDTITEVKIQEALDRLMAGRTSFVIAHRLNTIQKADQILVLRQGEITEKGSHQSLLKEKGFYYNLFDSQLTKQRA